MNVIKPILHIYCTYVLSSIYDRYDRYVSQTRYWTIKVENWKVVCISDIEYANRHRLLSKSPLPPHLTNSLNEQDPFSSLHSYRLMYRRKIKRKEKKKKNGLTSFVMHYDTVVYHKLLSSVITKYHKKLLHAHFAESV